MAGKSKFVTRTNERRHVRRRQLVLCGLLFSLGWGFYLLYSFRSRIYGPGEASEITILPANFEAPSSSASNASQSASGDSQLSASGNSLSVQNETVAMCLSGGLRAFELTAHSLVDHFLPGYGGDLFVFAPLDDNSHKIFLLQPYARIKAVKFLAQTPLNDRSKEAQVLLAQGSPHGVQGLLQYFELVEGCYKLITQAEERQGFMYDWVVRTRPDGYWTAPPPPISAMSPQGYTFPGGSDWGGANDRLGITKRGLAGKALSRLSVLRLFVGRVHGGRLNSETSLKAQLILQRTPAIRAQFHFCTLSQHRYSWPPSGLGVPVFSMASQSPLNGAKCRPCVPALTGWAAFKRVSTLAENMGLPFRPPVNYSSGLDLCDARRPWARHWPSIFDQQAGAAAATVRAQYAELNETDCVARVRQFLEGVGSYVGPNAEVLCKLKEWAWPAVVKGYPQLYTRALKGCDNIMYSVTSSETWEYAVVNALSVRNYVLRRKDPAPELATAKETQISAKKCASHSAKPWFSEDVLTVLNGGVPCSLLRPAEDATATVEKVAVVRLAALDDVRSLLKGLNSSTPFPVCQLLLPLPGGDSLKDDLAQQLQSRGCDLIRCSGSYATHQCTFACVQHC